MPGLKSDYTEDSAEKKQNRRNSTEQTEFPEYTCHKKVRGAKITEIQEHESNGEGSATMIFGEIGASKFLSDEWKERHNPVVGGYFVVYEDGYSSFSPGVPFENGYSLSK